MKKFSVVEIFWKDHYSLPDQWYDGSVADQPRVICSVGYLIEEDEEYYYLSTNYDEQAKHHSSGIAILKNCVTSKKVLKKEKTKNDFSTRKRKFNQNS